MVRGLPPLLVALALALPGPSALAADSLPVDLWGRPAFWQISLDDVDDDECPSLAKGLWELIETLPAGEKFVTGARVAGNAGDPQLGNLGGFVRGRTERKLKGLIEDPVCGEGKVALKMDANLRTVRGKAKFPGRSAKKFTLNGQTSSVDMFDLQVDVAFAAARRGFIKVDTKTVFLVVLQNDGPQPIQLGPALLQIGFSQPVRFIRGHYIPGIEGQGRRGTFAGSKSDDLKLKLAAPIVLPTVQTIAFVVEVAGTAACGELTIAAGLTANGSPPFPDLQADPPVLPSQVGTATIPISCALVVKMSFKNKDTQPIHVFLEGDPDPWSDRTRILPGKKRRIAVLEGKEGQTFVFHAGRDQMILDSCETGPLVGSGKGTGDWDPIKFPPFLALGCPGGF